MKTVFLLALLVPCQIHGQWFDYEPMDPYNFLGFNPSTIGEQIRTDVLKSLGQLPTRGNSFGLHNYNNYGPVPSYPFNNFHFNPQTLKQQIEANIAKSLEPMRTQMAHLAMTRGTGGVTLITIRAIGKQYIMYDGDAFTCKGTIQVQRGMQPTCIGSLSAASDPCVPGQNYIQQGNIRCFGRDLAMVNGVCVKGTRITMSELKTRCGPDFNTNNYAVYAYYPTIGNMKSVNIKNPNLRCDPTNLQAGVCSFMGY